MKDSESGPGVSGRIRVHPAGYGFVQREDGEVDVFVPAKYRGAAMDGDRVSLTTWLGHKGTEGRVDSVLERGRARITGIVRKVARAHMMEPDDPRLGAPGTMVALDGGPGAAHEGQCVVAEITVYPSVPGGAISARILRVLGLPDDPETEVAKVIACGEIPDEFPEEVLTAAERVPTEVGPADLADRSDLRDRDFLTIDPESARDFDDAICVEPGPRGGVIAWVAVADVTHYVQAGGALDREARVRQFSVYLPNRAIPMLPHQLSSGICSLNPEVDRCASVVRLEISGDGEVGATQVMSAVIRSRARLDYGGVAAALEGDFRGARARYREWAPALELMDKVAKAMRARRAERGALEMELPEAKVVLDDDDPRLVRDVVRGKPSAAIKGAYQLVESYMLAANEGVARYFRERGLDTLWRVHDKPDPERLEAFREVAESFGVSFDVEEAASPKTLQKLLRAMVGRPFERPLTSLALRSLKQAQYDVINVGHYGLASAEYLHFTSPIRRYPDLMVHRLLKHQLRKEGLPSGEIRQAPPPPRAELAAMAREASACERRAMEAEREVVDMYRAYFMRDRVGEEFDGVITAVTNFGFFVELVEPFVEGLVRIEALGGDGYEYDATRAMLMGRRNGRTFVIGQEVRVRIDSVSVARRRLDLSVLGGRADGRAYEGAPRPKLKGKRGAPVAGERGKRRGGPPERRGGGGAPERRGGGGGGGGGARKGPAGRTSKRRGR